MNLLLITGVGKRTARGPHGCAWLQGGLWPAGQTLPGQYFFFFFFFTFLLFLPLLSDLDILKKKMKLCMFFFSLYTDFSLLMSSQSCVYNSFWSSQVPTLSFICAMLYIRVSLYHRHIYTCHTEKKKENLRIHRLSLVSSRICYMINIQVPWIQDWWITRFLKISFRHLNDIHSISN